MNLTKFTKINAMQIKFHVPETLSEITLKQYQDFILLDKEMDEDAYLMAIAKIFVRGDLVHIEKLPLKKLNDGKLNFLAFQLPRLQLQHGMRILSSVA